MTKLSGISSVRHGYASVLFQRLKLAEFYMGANLEIAHKVGIAIPDEILLHADDSIPYKETNSPWLTV